MVKCRMCGCEMVRCSTCGEPLVGNGLCWICEVEEDGRDVHAAVSSKDDSISIWQQGDEPEGPGWTLLSAKQFVAAVREQAKEGL